MLTSSSGGGGNNSHPNKMIIGSSGTGIMNHHPLMSAPAFHGDEPGASDFEDIWNMIWYMHYFHENMAILIAKNIVRYLASLDLFETKSKTQL